MLSLTSTSLAELVWEWKDADSSGAWNKCSRFPTNIHHELRTKDLIPDEGIDLNERKIQWVGEKDWLFRTSFATPSDAGQYEHVVLAFDGLDTVVKVRLNGVEVLESDNMFIPHRLKVGKLLITDPSEHNELEMVFFSAARIARERMQASGKVWKNIRTQSRMYVRKAQYHWGWDWGPSLITCGPWKDARLEMYGSRIADLHVDATLNEACTSAELDISVEIEDPHDGETIRLSIDPAGLEAFPMATRASQTLYNTKVTVESPNLWWPIGYGDQSLYSISATLQGASHVLDRQKQRMGIRKIELVQRPLSTANGETFFFRVNNQPIFCMGTNWIPCHTQPALMTPELYRQNLKCAVENNNNMVRIWGGGIYEGDEFYNYCDEQGLMVWQDMMFACGIYPTNEAFHRSVEQELEANVKRLRNHPSIVLWNGDNEMFFMFDRQGPEGHYDAREREDFRIYPERKLIFETIPKVLSRLGSSLPYWPSSPFGGADANDLTVGDVHQWNVWHNVSSHYQFYPQLVGRFVSEYGMPGHPDIRTINHWCPDLSQRYPSSRVMDCHNKSGRAEAKTPMYLHSNFRLDYTNLEQTVFCSQLMQADALTYANRSWRRGWRGEGKEECGGVLVWQLNDVYPVTTWSLMDSFWRKKPAFYTVKRDFASITVGIARHPVWHFVEENKRDEYLTDIPRYEIYASNLTLLKREVAVTLRMYDWTAHKELKLETEVAHQKCFLVPNQSSELLELKSPPEVQESSFVILAVWLHDAASGEELSRHFSWPEPYRYLQSAKDTHVATEVLEGETSVMVKCGKIPAKGVILYVDEKEGEDADWEDNCFDLWPGETKTIGVKGLESRAVKVKWLYDWE